MFDHLHELVPPDDAWQHLLQDKEASITRRGVSVTFRSNFWKASQLEGCIDNKSKLLPDFVLSVKADFTICF